MTSLEAAVVKQQDDLSTFRLLLTTAIIVNIAVAALCFATFDIKPLALVGVFLSVMFTFMVVNIKDYEYPTKMHWFEAMRCGNFWLVRKGQWFAHDKAIRDEDLEQLPPRSWVRTPEQQIVLLRDEKTAVQLRLTIE